MLSTDEMLLHQVCTSEGSTCLGLSVWYLVTSWAITRSQHNVRYSSPHCSPLLKCSMLLWTHINWEESDESKSSGTALVIGDQIHFVNVSESWKMILQITTRRGVTETHFSQNYQSSLNFDMLSMGVHRGDARGALTPWILGFVFGGFEDDFKGFCPPLNTGNIQIPDILAFRYSN